MPNGRYDAEIAEIDALLAEPKVLIGPPPTWIPAGRPGELQASWPIADQSGVIRTDLRFRCPRYDLAAPSVSVIYRRHAIWRVDIVEPSVCKINPPAAHLLGLPAQVCGPHQHTWPDNREFVRQNGFASIPMRRALAAQVRRLPQAVAVLAAAINLDLGDYGRDFDAPYRSDLFQRL
jgi:hypothetical protein